MKKVGLIGLGAMGLGMAGSLRKAGFDLAVFDIRLEVAEQFAKDGGIACKTLEIGRASCRERV